MQEKHDADVRERFYRKKVLVLGPESDMKQKFLQVFRTMGFEISRDENDMSPEDYVILFGFTDRTPAADQGSQDAGRSSAKADSTPRKNDPTEGWQVFSSLLSILQKIESVCPKSVLFVSRSDIYGKLFGEFHPVKENELGYVCHTDMHDQDAERLRILENLCSRMAREDGVPVKIVRFPGREAPGSEMEAGAAGERAALTRDWKRIAELTARVLLDGTAGEAYNIEGFLQTDPGRDRPTAYAETSHPRSGEEIWRKTEPAPRMYADTTALEPIRIVMDTGKAGRLG